MGNGDHFKAILVFNAILEEPCLQPFPLAWSRSSARRCGVDGDRFADYGGGDDALDRAIAEFPTLRQLTPPGEVWAYSNTGFQLAGAVVQKLRGVPFETVARERLLRPLGLERTFYFPHEI